MKSLVIVILACFCFQCSDFAFKGSCSAVDMLSYLHFVISHVPSIPFMPNLLVDTVGYFYIHLAILIPDPSAPTATLAPGQQLLVGEGQ